MSTTITAKYVNQPKEGKKFGNVKTADDDLYWFPKAMGERLSPGELTFDWEEQKWGNNRVKVITMLNPPGATHAPPAATPARPMANGHNDSEAIFVTGVVGRAMGSGEFAAGDILELTQEAARAYRAWRAGFQETRQLPPVEPRRMPRPDLDDEIPF